MIVLGAVEGQLNALSPHYCHRIRGVLVRIYLIIILFYNVFISVPLSANANEVRNEEIISYYDDFAFRAEAEDGREGVVPRWSKQAFVSIAGASNEEVEVFREVSEEINAAVSGVMNIDYQGGPGNVIFLYTEDPHHLFSVEMKDFFQEVYTKKSIYNSVKSELSKNTQCYFRIFPQNGKIVAAYVIVNKNLTFKMMRSCLNVSYFQVFGFSLNRGSKLGSILNGTGAFKLTDLDVASLGYLYSYKPNQMIFIDDLMNSLKK